MDASKTTAAGIHVIAVAIPPVVMDRLRMVGAMVSTTASVDEACVRATRIATTAVVTSNEAAAFAALEHFDGLVVLFGRRRVMPKAHRERYAFASTSKHVVDAVVVWDRLRSSSTRDTSTM